MVSLDNIIEPSGLFVVNKAYIGVNADVYKTGTGYGFVNVSYDTPLIPNHLYYQRYVYKFTTTNQSPTWVNFYYNYGKSSGAGISNQVAGREYTISGIFTPVYYTQSYGLVGGTFYHGPSNSTSGVTGYVKNVITYDVTELFSVLKAYNIALDTNALKTWCDNKLTFVNFSDKLFIGNLITTQDKVIINQGNIIARTFIEPEGSRLLASTSSLINNFWCDSTTGVYVYNNNGNGTVTFSYVDAKQENSPYYNEHKKVLKITTNGSASPGAGGFYTNHMASANKYFLETFVAKIPVGYTVNAAYNSQGSGSNVYFLTSNLGTGNWEQYSILYKCGTSGSFSSGGHVYITGTSNTSVSWYVACVTDIDITSDTALQSLALLPNQVNIKGGVFSTHHINESNIIPNGSLSNNEQQMLPSGWSYDTSDIAGNGYKSIVQPVGVGGGTFGGKMKIDPSARYRVSFWVKCKQDMSNYLLAVYYYTKNGNLITHGDVNYYSGTKTTLAAPLNTGATTVKLTSVANWAPRSYARLGFRSNMYTSSWNDLGSWTSGGSTGCVSSVNTSTNTVTLTSAYTGPNRASGTVIVEGYDGGTYVYPIGKGNLPTDNTWKYVEGYFGVDGQTGDGSGGWGAIPGDVDSIALCLNLYSNNGTVPIKYCDIKIEQIGKQGGHKLENKIQIEKLK